jgi:hypothetical protein
MRERCDRLPVRRYGTRVSITKERSVSDPDICSEPIPARALVPPSRLVVGLALLAGLLATTTRLLPGVPLHPAELAWLSLLGCSLVHAWRQRQSTLVPMPWVVALVLATAGLGIGGADSLPRGVVEWGQLAIQLCVPILVIWLVPSLSRLLAKGLILGLGANALLAVGQRLTGVAPVEIGGMLGSRVLLATIGAALLPLGFRLLVPNRLARYRPLALGLVGLAVMAVALPQSALVVGLLLGPLLAYAPLRRRCRLTAWIMLAVLCAVVALRWAEMADFARLRDPDGTARRWVQEVIASGRAIRQRPLAGHGFGRYQAVVSSGDCRGTLPRPLETRVEPGRQCGYLVLAVEAGLPLALLLAAGLLIGGLRGIRSRLLRQRAAGLACWAVFLLVATTPLFVRGPGFVVGSLLALVGHRRGRRWWLPAQALLILLGVGTGVAMRQPATVAASEAMAPALPTENSVTVLLAAGRPQALPEWAELGDAEGLLVRDGVLQAGRDYAPASYAFSLSRPATVTLWLRASWHDGCGNSIATSFDDGQPRLVGNDGTYHSWHWVRGFQAALGAGRHELKLHPREDGLALDQILITSDPKAHPFGRLGDGGHSSAVAAVQPIDPPGLVARPRPFRFGIGGCYRGGFEAALIQLGLPWGKVNDYDLVDVERLKSYDVLCLSELKEVDTERCFAVLDAFVRAGGILIWENHTGRVPSRWRRSQTLLPYQIRWGLRAQTGDNKLKTDDSSLFAGIAPGTVIRMHQMVPIMRFRGKPGEGWTSHGQLTRYGRDAGPAFFERSLDKGKVHFLALPLSFHTMWKGRQFLPILNNLLRQVAGKANPPLHPGLAGTRPNRDGAWFGDDFMRARGPLGGGWASTGDIRCTGEDRSRKRIAFAAHAKAPARMTGGNAEWTGYRLAATVRTDNGTVSLNASTELGEPIELVWGSAKNELRLQRAGKILLATPLPPKSGASWRKLSLFGRGNVWYGFVDGQCKLRLDTDQAAALAGQFGVGVTEGEAYLDDVAVCPVAELSTGTDRALGEDGSPVAWGGLGQHGIECHTVYAMPWLTRTSAKYERAVELVLPNYQDAILRCDSGPGLRLGASLEPAVVSLPEAPQQWLAAVVPGWRDYVFSGRLTEWTPSGGDWIPLSRWSCDPEWHWVGTETARRSALWYDHELSPPYGVNAVLSLGARGGYGQEYERGRDLNLQLGGNGQDLGHGLSIRVMNHRDRGIELWRDGQRIAQAEGVGMPSGHTLHHNWYEVGAWVEANRVRVRFEGVTVLDQKLTEPLARGRLAVWTERNSLRVGRVTIAGGQGSRRAEAPVEK